MTTKKLFQTIINTGLSFIFLGALTGCDPFEPTSVKITSEKTFELKTQDGGWIALRPGQTLVGTASYREFGNQIHLSFGANGTAVFKRAKVDERAGTVVSTFKKSGQETKTGEKLALDVQRQPYCRPDCSSSSSSVETYRCTYYVREPYTVCNRTPEGGSNCWTEWRDSPRSGQQRVEVTRTNYFFEITGRIVGETSGQVASSNGRYTDTQERVRALTSCR